MTARGRKKAPAPQDITAILGKVRPREHTVTIYLAGDLGAELDDLERDLKDATLGAASSGRSLGDVDPRKGIADRIAAVQKELADSAVTLRFRALSGKGWSDLLAAHPARTKTESFNVESIQAPLLAACCADPAMTLEQAEQLLGELNEGQRIQLFDAGWRVNTEAVAVPFSLLASAARASSAEK